MHCAIAGSLVHKFEDYANITLKFKDGRSNFIEANWLTPIKVRLLIVTGTEEILQVEYISQEVTVKNHVMMYTLFFGKEEPLRVELQYFLNSITND